MKTRILLFTSAFAFTLFESERADAAGTALDVQSARGTGMASAMTAATDGADSIFFNPAGIARGKTFDVQVGDTLIVPGFSYTSPAGNKTTLPFYIVPPLHAYASAGITDDLSIGIGLFTPYGLKVKWPTGWEGRRVSEESELQTFYINPTVAYRYGPIRIGAGFQLVRGTVELRRAITYAPGQEGDVDLGAGAWGVGANGGIQLDVIEQYLTLGATYRSAVKLGFDGDAHFSNVPPAIAQTIHDQPVSTALVQPDQLGVGVASRPIPALLLDFDAVWLGWSRLRSINITFPQDASGTLSSSMAKEWKDRVNLHLGGEWTIDDHWRVRAGVLYDPTPAPQSTLTPEIPDATRLNLAVGGGYAHETGFRVDLGYQFLVLFSRTSTAAPLFGEYGGNVNLLGITVGYSPPMHREPPPENVPLVEPPPPEAGQPPAEPAPAPPPETTPAPPPP